MTGSMNVAKTNIPAERLLMLKEVTATNALKIIVFFHFEKYIHCGKVQPELGEENVREKEVTKVENTKQGKT